MQPRKRLDERAMRAKSVRKCEIGFHFNKYAHRLLLNFSDYDQIGHAFHCHTRPSLTINVVDKCMFNILCCDAAAQPKR